MTKPKKYFHRAWSSHARDRLPSIRKLKASLMPNHNPTIQIVLTVYAEVPFGSDLKNLAAIAADRIQELKGVYVSSTSAEELEPQ